MWPTLHRSDSKRERRGGGCGAAWCSLRVAGPNDRCSPPTRSTRSPRCWRRYARRGRGSRSDGSWSAISSALPDAALPLAVTYLGGRPFPRGDGRTLSVGGATLDAALRAARPELTDETVTAAWRRHADAGDAAAELWTGAVLPDPAPHPADGGGGALRGAPRRARPAGEDHAARGRLSRDGRARDPSVRQGDARRSANRRAGADARGRRRPRQPASRSRRCAPRTATGPTSARSRSTPAGDASSRREFTYFTPVDPMLAQPAADAADAIRRLGTPLWVEDKYDGVRCQLHKVDADVRLFSRDRRELTPQFPEVVAAFAAAPGRYVLDGEVLAMEAGRALPFLRLQQRLGRLVPTPDVVAAHPVAFVAFDCLAREDQGLLDEPLRTRRATLETLALPPGQVLAPVWTASQRRGARRPLRGGPGPRQRGTDGQAAGVALRVGPPRRPVAQGEAPARHPRRRRGRRRMGAREAPGGPLGPHLRGARRGHGAVS